MATKLEIGDKVYVTNPISFVYHMEGQITSIHDTKIVADFGAPFGKMILSRIEYLVLGKETY